MDTEEADTSVSRKARKSNVGSRLLSSTTAPVNRAGGQSALVRSRTCAASDRQLGGLKNSEQLEKARKLRELALRKATGMPRQESRIVSSRRRSPSALSGKRGKGTSSRVNQLSSFLSLLHLSYSFITVCSYFRPTWFACHLCLCLFQVVLSPFRSQCILYVSLEMLLLKHESHRCVTCAYEESTSLAIAGSDCLRGTDIRRFGGVSRWTGKCAPVGNALKAA